MELLKIIVIDDPSSKEKNYVCKWCLNKKSKEEVGLLDEKSVDELYLPLIQDLENKIDCKYLRSCNDCILLGYRMDNFLTKCELVQFHLQRMSIFHRAQTPPPR